MACAFASWHPLPSSANDLFLLILQLFGPLLVHPAVLYRLSVSGPVGSSPPGFLLRQLVPLVRVLPQRQDPLPGLLFVQRRVQPSPEHWPPSGSGPGEPWCRRGDVLRQVHLREESLRWLPHSGAWPISLGWMSGKRPVSHLFLAVLPLEVSSWRGRESWVSGRHPVCWSPRTPPALALFLVPGPQRGPDPGVCLSLRQPFW